MSDNASLQERVEKAQAGIQRLLGGLNQVLLGKTQLTEHLVTGILAGGHVLLIIGFFLVTQGFAKRGGSLALIALDEETDSAITFSRHVFYSGLYPLGGFRFTRDTAFCPLEADGDRESFALDLTEEQQLRSGLFSPSVSFHYLTVRHWTTRAKLVWDLDDMTVLNGFDGEAERVVLRVGNKAYEASRVPAGGKAQLTELPTPVPGNRALVR